jgi:hypothetical protein
MVPAYQSGESVAVHKIEHEKYARKCAKPANGEEGRHD